jgi:UDP-N-acetylmuramate dehydrogenase
MTLNGGENTSPELQIRHNVSLAPLTTLELGGTAHAFAEVGTVAAAREAVQWAWRQNLPFVVLGGGSNIVVADRGFQGLGLCVGIRGITTEYDDDRVVVTANAGEPWDELVESTVAAGLSGLECLSGIPGWVGATPIQNVGAYGQEVSAVIDRVQVLDLTSLDVRDFGPDECGFGYRTSTFREFPGRYLVLSVTFVLSRGGVPKIEYQELRRALGIGRANPSPAEVRDVVLELRRGKSMVVDEDDANRRSVGSFFVNPVVDAMTVAALEDRARADGALSGTEGLPTFPTASGFKIPAAWLIENAGFSKGMRRGAFGISTAHALALVHHGGGTSAELIALAKDIHEGVRRRFDIDLQPEPVFIGFPTANPLEKTF